MEEHLLPHLTELIRLAATDLPNDVEEGLKSAWKKEEPGSAAAQALETILVNIELARKESLPICQDTGTLNFYVSLPSHLSATSMAEQIKEAVRAATDLSYLRPNVVNALTDENTGSNVGADTFPFVEFSCHQDAELIVDLLLKGGGCENVSTQYALPNLELKADRSFEGIKKCVLHAVFKAQGLGCPPGIVGVAVGGDRAIGYREAKRVLLRRIGDRPADTRVANLKEKIRKMANNLNIGPMGFGGKTTLLDVHITFLHRHPASYFVSVSYSCWALRRRRLIWDGRKATFL
ncbi:MAG: fumarate hydratase [Syntrophales bacterium]|nr:fumarate hydratase [Syntrophales bacterium]